MDKRSASTKLLPFLLLLALSGCQLSYYSQAIQGQLALMDKSEPVSKVLQNPQTPVPVRQQLALAQQVLTYAADEMDLP
ncbi:MAG TPA: aminopeptidase, partial [Acidobacteriaceae bacterium]|nr:aminopeptidase [Acidobacteriaceae bacterium]